jgi:hypothetical protein
MNFKMLVAALLTAPVLLAVTWPQSCSVTLMGFGAGQPDRNVVSCDARWGNELGANHVFEAGSDVLVQRLKLHALALTAAVVVIVLTAGRLLRRRSLSWWGLALAMTLMLGMTVAAFAAEENEWFYDGSGIRRITGT